MIWKVLKKKSIVMIYGFKESDTRFYGAVLTLYRQGNTTVAYGFLSKVELEISDLRALWSKLQEVIDTRYLEFEVLPEHAELYKQNLSIDAVVKQKTFDGYDSEVLRVVMK